MGFGPIRRDFTLLSLSLTCCLSAMSFFYNKTLSQVYFLLHWQPPALPCRLQQSTIGRLSLNRRVRDGNGCLLKRIATSKFISHFGSRLPPLNTQQQNNPYFFFLRKEVIQPHLPIRLPCYDFTPVIGSTFGSSSLAVRSLTSGISNSHGVTGGVYKTRERIHRDMLIRDY